MSSHTISSSSASYFKRYTCTLHDLRSDLAPTVIIYGIASTDHEGNDADLLIYPTSSLSMICPAPCPAHTTSVHLPFVNPTVSPTRLDSTSFRVASMLTLWLSMRKEGPRHLGWVNARHLNNRRRQGLSGEKFLRGRASASACRRGREHWLRHYVGNACVWLERRSA